jgi:hypothetical protein
LEQGGMSSWLMALAIGGLSLSACAPASKTLPTRRPNFDATATLVSPAPAEPLSTETPDFFATNTKIEAERESDGLEALNAATTTTPISLLENASQAEIVETLLHKWLEYYKTDSVSEYLRLKDYRIEQIKPRGYCAPPDKNTTKSLASAQISVQTVTLHPGDWVALPGNLIIGDDHWLYHLAPYVLIYASQGIYTLGVGGAPLCSE